MLQETLNLCLINILFSYSHFSPMLFPKVVQNNLAENTECLEKSFSNTSRTRPRKKKVWKLTYLELWLFVMTVYRRPFLTLSITTSCFLICCLAVMLISLRLSLRCLWPRCLVTWCDLIKAICCRKQPHAYLLWETNMGHGMLPTVLWY